MTKQKISGFVSRGNCNILQAQEYLESASVYIGPYFGSAGNFLHDIREFQPNTMYVYCKGTPMAACGQCSSHDPIVMENTYGFDIANAVYEWMHLNVHTTPFFRVTPEKYVTRLCPNSIRIMMDGFVIGEFCPAKNILLTTDWTDTAGHMDFVKNTLEKMERMGLLEKKKFKKIIPKITLGADPELEVVTGPENRTVLNASNFPDYMDARIGRDGSGSQRELRPEPGSSPDELVKNIEKLLKYPTGEKWSVKGEKYSLGGHIHIGGVQESPELYKALDYFLDPLESLQGPARKGSGYGRKSDVRKQPHGIEYRTPPSAWLATRTLAKLTLTVTEAVCKKHYAGEDIEITGDLVEDIVSLGLDRRVALDFMSEVEKVKNNLPSDIRKSWGIKQEVCPTVEFRDNWDSKVKSMFRDTVIKHLKDLEIEDTIIFYGVREDRGKVFSMDVKKVTLPEGYSKIPALREGIGVPHSVRNVPSEAREMLETLKAIVEAYVKN